MPEKFENSIFTLKINHMFSIHTTLYVEKFEIATITSGCQSCWILCLRRPRKVTCTIIVTLFWSTSFFVIMSTLSVKLVFSNTSGLKECFWKVQLFNAICGQQIYPQKQSCVSNFSGLMWTAPQCSVTYFDSDSFLYVQLASKIL